MIEKRWIDVHVIEARNLPVMDTEGGQSCDPYVKVGVSGKTLETRVVMKSLCPVWNETLSLPLNLEPEGDCVVTIMDWDMDAHDVVGSGPSHHEFSIPPKT